MNHHESQCRANYDAAGNQISAGGGSFAYDAENRQKTVTLSAPQSGAFTYSYDGEGFRVKRSVYGMESVYFHDAFGRVVTEYRNGNWLKDFVYLGGQLLAVEDSQGRFYVTADHLGSTRLVTEADRDVRSRHDYLPFGKEVPPDLGGRAGVPGYMVPGWSPTHRVSEPLLQRFTGQEVDPETGLNHFMFRYYSGRQGRFTSADPVSSVEPDPLDPQSLNAYSYGLNNPLLYVDPLGLSTTCYVDGVLSSCSTLSTLVNMGAAFLSPWSPGTMIRWNRDTNALQLYVWAGQYEDSQNIRFDEAGNPQYVIQFETTQGWRWLDTRMTLDNASILAFAGVKLASDFSAGAGDFITFNVTERIRQRYGTNGVVDQRSGAYAAGFVTGIGVTASVGALATGKAVAGLGTKIAIHGAHHAFGALGRLPHLQIMWWIAGARQSGQAIRIPLTPWWR